MAGDDSEEVGDFEGDPGGHDPDHEEAEHGLAGVPAEEIVADGNEALDDFGGVEIENAAIEDVLEDVQFDEGCYGVLGDVD